MAGHHSKSTSPHTPADTVSLRNVYQLFDLDNRARRLSPRTRATYRWHLHRFMTWCEAQDVHQVHQVQAAHVRAYLVEAQDSGWGAWTMHGAAWAIRRYFTFAVDEDLLQRVPKFTLPKLPKAILPAFTPEDIERLLATANTTRNRALVLFLLDTGVRATEACTLNVGSVDVHTGVVIVRDGKGQKDQYVFVGDRTATLVLRYLLLRGKLPADAPLWVTEGTSKRMTANGLLQMLRKLGKAAGVAHCHPHTFRRTFALWSLRAGMDVYRLARLMGHSDITTLRHYLDLVTEDVQAAHQAAGPVDHMLK